MAACCIQDHLCIWKSSLGIWYCSVLMGVLCVQAFVRSDDACLHCTSCAHHAAPIPAQHGCRQIPSPGCIQLQRYLARQASHRRLMNLIVTTSKTLAYRKMRTDFTSRSLEAGPLMPQPQNTPSQRYHVWRVPFAGCVSLVSSSSLPLQHLHRHGCQMSVSVRSMCLC